VRRMRRALVLAGVLGCLGPGVARAEVGIGPPVVASVPMNSRLTDVVPTIIAPDDPSAVVDASVSATVSAGGGVVAELGPYSVVATGAPKRLDMPLPKAAVQRLQTVTAKSPHAYATVAYAVQQGDGTSGLATDHMQSTMSLFAPLIPHRPTAISVDGESFTGSATPALGTVALPAPRSWPRTSLGLRRRVTFGPIAVAGRCSAYAVAFPRLIAVEDLSSYLGHFNRFDGARRGRQLAVRASRVGDSYASASAVGLRKIASHRFAGVQIYLDFDPECPAEAPRTHSFLKALTGIVRDVTAHVTTTRRRCCASLQR
jgi:hypothetical protein